MATLPLFLFERAAEFSLPDTLLLVALVSRALHSVVVEEKKRLQVFARDQDPSTKIKYFAARYRTRIPVEDPTKFPDLGQQATQLFRRLEIHLGASLLHRAPSVARAMVIPGMSLEESIQPTKVEWGIRVPRRRKDGRPAEFLSVHWLYRRVFETVGEHSLGACLGAGETQDSRYNLVTFNVHQDFGNSGVSGVTVIFIFDQHSGELCDSYWNLEVGAAEVRIAAQTDDLPERMVSSIPSVFAHLFMFKSGAVPIHESNGAATAESSSEPAGVTTASKREVPGGVFMPSTPASQAEDLEPMESLCRFDIVNANHCPWTLTDLIEITTAAASLRTNPLTTLLPTSGPETRGVNVVAPPIRPSPSPACSSVLQVIDRQFFDPFTKMVSGVQIPVFRVKEEEADLTTPKGTWRCRTGMASLRQVDMDELWTKKVGHYKQLFARFWRNDLMEVLRMVPLGELVTQVSSFDRATLRERAAVNAASGLAPQPKSATTPGPMSPSGVSIGGLSAFQLALPGGGSLGDHTSLGRGGETDTMANVGSPDRNTLGDSFSGSPTSV